MSDPRYRHVPAVDHPGWCARCKHTADAGACPEALLDRVRLLEAAIETHRAATAIGPLQESPKLLDAAKGLRPPATVPDRNRQN